MGRKLMFFSGLLVCLVGAAAPSVRAQVTSGTILGTVTDPSGAAIPGAKVTITNLGTKIARTFETDATGNYVISYLIPGTYAVTAEKDGFKKATQTGITLVIDQKARVDLTLRVGSVAETVTVTGEAPLVKTVSSEQAQVIDSRQIVNLPLNIRDFAQLVSLSTGAVPSPGTLGGQFDNPDNPQGISDTNVNGLRADANNWQIDGVSDNETFFNIISVNPSIDAIAEFKVTTNNYSAEFGRAGGANVQVSIKSGTNNFHGVGFEFLRNDKLDATPWDVNRAGGKNPAFRQNQFGGNLGGPIKKDRTFFFADFERFTERKLQTNSSIVLPTMKQRVGDFSEPGNNVMYNPFNLVLNPTDGQMHPQPFGDGMVDSTNVIPANLMSKAAANIMKLLPAPTDLTAPIGRPNFFGTASFAHDTNNLDARVDHKIRDRDQFFARYSLLSTTENNPPFLGTTVGGAPWLNFAGNTRNQNVVISEVHTLSPRTVNEFRFGVNRVRTDWFGLDKDLKTSDEVGIPGVNSFCGSCGGLSYINIPGFFDTSSPFSSVGHAPFAPTFRHDTVFQWVDDVTFVRGRHTIKTGTDIQRVRADLLQDQSPLGDFEFNGNYTSDLNARGTGSSLASSLLGHYGGATRGNKLTFPSTRASRFAFFGQDDIRVNEKLTLNLGLRYEYYTPYTDSHNNLDQFDLTTGDILLACIATSCTGGVKPDRKDFAPRIGFAYTPDRGKTAIRGGVGISYYFPGYLLGTLTGNYPFTSNQQKNPANSLTVTPDDPTLDQGLPLTPNCRVSAGNCPVRPGAPPGHLIPKGAGGSSVVGISYLDQTFKLPRTYQWNFGIQRAITPNLLVDVAYVGNTTRHIFGDFSDANTRPLGASTANPGVPAQQLRPYFGIDPELGTITERIMAGNSNYHSLQAKLEKRLSHGLSFLTAYTWSKALERGPQGSGNRYYLDPNNTMAMQYLTSFDVASRLVVSYIYELPIGRNKQYGKSWSGVPNAVLGGWQLGGITTYQSGFPFGVGGNAGNLDNGLSNQPNRVCNGAISNPTIDRWFDTSCFVKGPANVYGNTNFNILRGPSFRNWDVSLAKNFPLKSESRYLQFRAEFFDAFNNVNFANPSGSISVTPTNPDGSGAGGNRITALKSQVGGIKARQIQFALKLYF